MCWDMNSPGVAQIDVRASWKYLKLREKYVLIPGLYGSAS